MTLRKISLLAILLFFVSYSGLQAETIHLKKGMHIKGKILQTTSESVTIERAEDNEVITVNRDEIFMINFKEKDEEQQKQKPLASSIYLKNGEIVKGAILKLEEQTLMIESLKGQGRLRIPMKDVVMITSADRSIRMNQRNGLGYVSHKSTLQGDTPVLYNQDSISYKSFLEENLFQDILFAYANSSKEDRIRKLFAVDYRMGWIFDRYENVLFYYGGSVGYISVTDVYVATSGATVGVDGSGYTAKGFLGAEFFFNSLPNFGFAGELGIGQQKIGNFSAIDISSSSFPALTIHYYF